MFSQSQCNQVHLRRWRAIKGLTLQCLQWVWINGKGEMRRGGRGARRWRRWDKELLPARVIFHSARVIYHSVQVRVICTPSQLSSRPSLLLSIINRHCQSAQSLCSANHIYQSELPIGTAGLHCSSALRNPHFQLGVPT